MRFQLPRGTHTIENVFLDERPTATNDNIRKFVIGKDAWRILPADQSFDVIQSNNRAAALKSGNQTYFAEFSQTSSDSLTIQLRRENCKQVYRFDLKLAPAMAEIL